MLTLKEKILKYQEIFKENVPLDTRMTMVDATQKLNVENISSKALKVGEIVEPFSLPNAVKEKVSLQDILDNNLYVVLNFYRGGWCPYCNLELKALQNILPDLEALNTALVAISPQAADGSLSTKEKNELSFEVLSDEKNVIAKKFGLVFKLPAELKPIYKSFDIDITMTNEDTSYELPMAATYILDKQGVIVFAFVDEDYTRRCEPQRILDTIKKINKKK